MPQSIELPRIRTSFSNQSLFLTEDRLSPVPHDISGLFAQTESYDQSELENIHPLWKRDLYALLEQANSSVGAFLVHFLMTFFILVSAVVTVLETVPAFHSINPQIWFGMETTLVALFTVEYLARCTAWSSSWSSLLKWMISFYGVIDLLSVLPYYIEVIMQQDTAVFFRFSILRMFRLIRVFRPFRYNHTILLTIEVMYLSVRRSRHALLAISFFVVMVLTISSTLLYFAERGTWDTTLETFINSDGDPTQFASIPAAAWFVLVTITTVGYGEITPRSFLGRLVTVPLLVFGLLLIALPSFVLGREFSIVWEKMTTQQQLQQQDDDRDLDSPVELRSAPPVRSDREISTRKLALNQAELSRQILDLRSTVEVQDFTYEMATQFSQISPVIIRE
ncbi:Potassium voltage-gated channel subfamily B member 2 [Lentinula edodes]|uniref:Potassium voltage-gated channel subfamily B member 2 n=1 Tax=Lentinula edodes TaxID=5353 RepID=A0A1Q3EIT7_LENED|nr:Potassium voltage-gated channel subfamily B member 2 [Lentinula edodes]